jgi:hypothetical protein
MAVQADWNRNDGLAGVARMARNLHGCFLSQIPCSGFAKATGARACRCAPRRWPAPERSDHLACKHKGSLDVPARHHVNFVLGDPQEWLPHAESRVEERHADVSVRPVESVCINTCRSRQQLLKKKNHEMEQES